MSYLRNNNRYPGVWHHHYRSVSQCAHSFDFIGHTGADNSGIHGYQCRTDGDGDLATPRPKRRDVLFTLVESTPDDVDAAITEAAQAFTVWQKTDSAAQVTIEACCACASQPGAFSADARSASGWRMIRGEAMLSATGSVRMGAQVGPSRLLS